MSRFFRPGHVTRSRTGQPLGPKDLLNGEAKLDSPPASARVLALSDSAEDPYHRKLDSPPSMIFAGLTPWTCHSLPRGSWRPRMPQKTREELALPAATTTRRPVGVALAEKLRVHAAASAGRLAAVLHSCLLRLRFREPSGVSLRQARLRGLPCLGGGNKWPRRLASWASSLSIG